MTRGYIVACRVVAEDPRWTDRLLRRLVLERDGFRCRYCGVALRPYRQGREHDDDEATVDHIVPRSRGGADEATNMVACCWRCNQDKADTVPDSA